ncbi:unnamed protein product [Sphagnum jensenii]|uniref:LOB domain-containing protein n=1 Tax=Sphagnum jensenii TaxID=128206 RepID=A0ABP1BZ49_9BRYO
MAKEKLQNHDFLSRFSKFSKKIKSSIYKNSPKNKIAHSSLDRRATFMDTSEGQANSSSTPCAACKLLRRRCVQDCPFSPYFSPNEPQKFACVHKVFGASNVSKMLMEVPESQRADAASSLVYEAKARIRDPVYGCMGAISALQQQAQSLQTELNAVRREIMRYKHHDNNIPRSFCFSLFSKPSPPPPPPTPRFVPSPQMAVHSPSFLLLSSSSPVSVSVSTFSSSSSSSPSRLRGISASSSSSECLGSFVKEDDDEAAFEERLAKLQRKATSGTGKKAELRKARKADGTSSSSSGNLSSRGKSKSIMLPPVALQEPVSDGLEVALGFNSYTERLNGRFAGLGLAAMLLVELATGGSFLKYHDVSTLSTQLYAMLAAAALFVKYEKEKVSVWPKN